MTKSDGTAIKGILNTITHYNPTYWSGILDRFTTFCNIMDEKNAWRREEPNANQEGCTRTT